MLLIIIILVAFCIIFPRFIENKKYIEDGQTLKNPNASEEVKSEIRRTRYLENKKHNEIVGRYERLKMVQSCKFENVYGTYKDSSLDSKTLSLNDSCVSYETNTGISFFTIPYGDIIDAKCDTTENLTAMRFIALGVLAFAFKKKTYYTVITYKDDLTNSDQQLIFRVDNPTNKDDFINNLLIKRNQYLLNKKQPI